MDKNAKQKSDQSDPNQMISDQPSSNQPSTSDQESSSQPRRSLRNKRPQALANLSQSKSELQIPSYDFRSPKFQHTPIPSTSKEKFTFESPSATNKLFRTTSQTNLSLVPDLRETIQKLSEQISDLKTSIDAIESRVNYNEVRSITRLSEIPIELDKENYMQWACQIKGKMDFRKTLYLPPKPTDMKFYETLKDRFLDLISTEAKKKYKLDDLNYICDIWIAILNDFVEVRDFHHTVSNATASDMYLITKELRTFIVFYWFCITEMKKVNPKDEKLDKNLNDINYHKGNLNRFIKDIEPELNVITFINSNLTQNVSLFGENTLFFVEMDVKEYEARSQIEEIGQTQPQLAFDLLGVLERNRQNFVVQRNQYIQEQQLNKEQEDRQKEQDKQKDKQEQQKSKKRQRKI